MSSRRFKAFDFARRAVRRDPSHREAGPAGRRGARREESVVRRELDSFRRSQGLPYWHHDHR